jgi:leader peptidase (prepilin peptidase) / N-methyltransferase
MPALATDAAWPGLALLAAGWAVLGWVAGILINRPIYQLPRDRSPRRHPRCEHCGHRIPVLGWPVRQACSRCGEPLGYDRVEWIAAAAFALLACHFGPSGSLVAYSVYTVILLIVTAIDFRHRYVYAIVVYPGVVLAAILTPLLTGLDLMTTLIGIGVGTGIFVVFYLVGLLVYRGTEPIGKGDIEIAALAGAMVGYPRVLSALFLGGVVSAVVVLLLLAARRRGRRDFVPYGPGMCLGTFAAFFMTP